MIGQRRLLPSTSALAAFEAAARLGGFTAAARELNLTQGAISRHIRALETQLGRKLFEREGQGVTLTTEGDAYATDVRQALHLIRTSSLRAMMNLPVGTLNLAMPPTFGTRWLMPRMPGFLAENPGITINFATRTRHFDFDRERIDAAIHVIHGGELVWTGAACELLMRERVAPVCSPDFLEGHDIREPRDLLEVPLLHMASRPKAWSEWFATQGIETSRAAGMQFEQFATVARASIAGLGVALLPLFLIDGELARGQLIRTVGEPIISSSAYYFVSPRANASHPQVVAFREWLLRTASDPILD